MGWDYWLSDSDISVDDGGRLIGMSAKEACSFVLVSSSSEGSRMSSDAPEWQKADLVLATLRANYNELLENNRRLTDRALVVISSVVAGFGLLHGLNNKPMNRLSLALLLASLVCMACAFGFCYCILSPKTGAQPGKNTLEDSWRHFMAKPSDTAIANTIGDICDSIGTKMELLKVNARYMRYLLIASFACMMLIVLSEVASGF